MLERGLGYHLQQRKNGFFAKRNTKGFVPSDGHWRFIVLYASPHCNSTSYIGDPIGEKRSLRRSLFLYKNIQTLAYVIFLLYLCTRKGFEIV